MFKKGNGSGGCSPGDVEKTVEDLERLARRLERSPGDEDRIREEIERILRKNPGMFEMKCINDDVVFEPLLGNSLHGKLRIVIKGGREDT